MLPLHNIANKINFLIKKRIILSGEGAFDFNHSTASYTSHSHLDWHQSGDTVDELLDLCEIKVILCYSVNNHSVNL